MTAYIAGVGTRKINNKKFKEIEEFSRYLTENYRVVIRSGHAQGTDYAWECGAQNNCDVYLPWLKFGSELSLRSPHVFTIDDADDKIKELAEDSVAQFHPNYRSLRKGGYSCMTRNYFQVMGHLEESPRVKAVVCCAKPKGGRANLFTPKKQTKIEVQGGTGQAVRIANFYDIPVFNIYDRRCEDILPYLLKTFQRKSS